MKNKGKKYLLKINPLGYLSHKTGLIGFTISTDKVEAMEFYDEVDDPQAKLEYYNIIARHYLANNEIKFEIEYQN